MTAVTPIRPEFSGTGTVVNPATGAVAGQVQWTDPADVPRIAAGLRAAQGEWEQRGAKGRAKVLARFAVWLGKHRDEIEKLLIAETGKSAVDAAQGAGPDEPDADPAGIGPSASRRQIAESAF